MNWTERNAVTVAFKKERKIEAWTEKNETMSNFMLLDGGLIFSPLKWEESSHWLWFLDVFFTLDGLQIVCINISNERFEKQNFKLHL